MHLFLVFGLFLLPMSAAPLPANTTALKAGDRMTLTINDVEYAFRWCPPGTFTMGSPQNERRRDRDERQHQVTLTRGFWMLETEVTQKMWESVMPRNPSRFQGENLPVERVSWNDCQEFVNNLNGLGIAPEGFRFSLPTEAQWEYACRAGTTTAYHFGNRLNPNQANFESSARVDKTTAVGSYPANAWGLFDMHGNVWEWCADWYGRYPNRAITDPTGPQQGRERVLRGGSWDDGADDARSAKRDEDAPTDRDDDVGFRLVLVSESR